METLGFISALAYCFSAAPLAFRAWKTGSTDLSWDFLGLWGVGASGTLIYVISLNKPILIMNTGLNTLIFLVILYFKVFPSMKD